MGDSNLRQLIFFQTDECKHLKPVMLKSLCRKFLDDADELKPRGLIITGAFAARWISCVKTVTCERT